MIKAMKDAPMVMVPMYLHDEVYEMTWAYRTEGMYGIMVALTDAR